MAYYWTIPFADIEGNTFTIKILNSGASWDRELMGAAVPFVTQEDDNDDMFMPVRGQSGYIRIVDMGEDADGNTFDWRDLIPDEDTEKPVFLYNSSNTLVWCGFMKPETFQGEFEMMPQEREFPVMSPLDALEALEFRPGTDDTISIAGILEKIFSSLSDYINVIDYFYFQGTDAITDYSVTTWLYYRVATGLFTDADDDGNTIYKYNCLEVLQYVCQFFGWTCRMNGPDIWFVSPAQDIASNGFMMVDLQDLYYIETQYTVQCYPYSFISVALYNSFKSKNNTETYIPGLRKVTVTEDVDKIDTVFELPGDEMKELGVKNEAADAGMWADNMRSGTYGSTGGWYAKDIISTLNNPSQGEYNYTFTFKNITIETPGFGGVQSSLDYFFKMSLIDWDDSAFSNGALVKKNYNFSPVFILSLNTYAYSSGVIYLDKPAAIITSRYKVGLTDGVLVINMDVQNDVVEDDAHATYNGAGLIYMSVRIGDRYYNANNTGEWELVSSVSDWLQEAVFSTTLGGGSPAQGTGAIYCNRTLNGDYPPYSGFGIPVSNVELYGEIEIKIYSVLPYGGFSNINVTSFSMEFLRGNSYLNWNDRDKNTYISDAGNSLINTREVSNIFTVDENNAPGNGILLDPAGGYATGMTFSGSGGGSQYSPGQHLADAILAFYNTPRRILTLELPRHLYEFTPQHKVTYDGSTYYVLSVSNNWRDDICTVKLIKL